MKAVSIFFTHFFCRRQILEWYTNPVLPVPSIGTGPVSEPGYFYQNHRNHTVKLFLVVFEILQTISMELSKCTGIFIPFLKSAVIFSSVKKIIFGGLFCHVGFRSGTGIPGAKTPVSPVEPVPPRTGSGNHSSHQTIGEHL